MEGQRVFWTSSLGNKTFEEKLQTNMQKITNNSYNEVQNTVCKRQLLETESIETATHIPMIKKTLHLEGWSIFMTVGERVLLYKISFFQKTLLTTPESRVMTIIMNR